MHSRRVTTSRILRRGTTLALVFNLFTVRRRFQSLNQDFQIDTDSNY